jgi:excinuclease ABC subunit B
LLREGLDIPEVALVAILDADKEGFLRSAGSLIQTFGRAARNVEGHVILYADAVTGSMREAMEETSRRRAKQLAWNAQRRIEPRTIVKSLESTFDSLYDAEDAKKGRRRGERRQSEPAVETVAGPQQAERLIRQLERDMREAARELEFERAAALRDRIRLLRERFIQLS